MYKNLLIPVILDDPHDSQASFLVALALAEDEAKFTILHVVESIPSYVSAQLPAEVLATNRDEIERRLKQLSAGLPGAEAKLVSGHAGRGILDFANENDIDCIVVASHKPGLESYFLGSTADRVVRHARCSVHVIR